MKRLVISGWNWFDEFYARFAKLLLIFCLLAATGGVIIGTTAQIASGKNAAADRTLVSCLNDWAAENSTVSKEVRVASDAKDEAVTYFNATLADEGDAFHDLVKALIKGDQSEFSDLLLKLERTLQIRADANQQVIDAQNELDRVREANPVPPSPTVFCDLDAQTTDRTE